MNAEEEFHRPIACEPLKAHSRNNGIKPSQTDDHIAENAQEHPDMVAHFGESLAQT